MPAERYYSTTDLQFRQRIILDEHEFHHLIHVMRSKVGDKVEVINGRGVLALARVVNIDKRQAVLEISESYTEPPPPFELILAQSLPRLNRLDMIVEKGTELGMTQLWLFPGDRSERKDLTAHQFERIKAQTIAATKQCGRLYAPGLSLLPPLCDWSGFDRPLFFGDVKGSAPWLNDALEELPAAKGLIIIIGPESGLSIEEEIHLDSLGARGVKLHKNILRTDTAALSAMTMAFASLMQRDESHDRSSIEQK